MAISAILTESSYSANPQDVGAARSPGHTIRDRSSKQPALPYKKPDRPFVSQCVDVNAGGPLVTLIYLCLAARCRAFVDGDTGTCRIGRERLQADTKMGLTAFEHHHAALLATGLVSVKRTGRTNIYIVRTVAAMLRASNANDPEDDREPWKAADVSRRTWYRDRARTKPKTTHGGARCKRLSSGTDTPSRGVSDTPSRGVSTEEGSEGGSTRTKRRARASCSTCNRTWPASYGVECYHCAKHPPQRESSAPRPNWNPDGYRGTRIRNCPQCHTLERGYADRCQHCEWTRAAWEARGGA